MSVTELHKPTCRWDYICKRNGRYREDDEPDNHCQHGGGTDCLYWRLYTNEALGGYDPFPQRSWSK